MHVRKVMTKKEIAEYNEWKSKHDAAVERAKLSKGEREKRRQSYWASQSALVNQRLTARGDNREIPSLPPQPVEQPKPNPLLDMDPEEREEYLRREAEAQREIELKKSRVGPTYNKGGNQYWSEGMLEDLKGGGHRRR